MRQSKALFVCCLLYALGFLWSTQAGAVTFELFSEGVQTSDYAEIIQSLKRARGHFQKPTFLQFSHNTLIEVTDYLGNGGLTAIFLRADGRALRVPLATGEAIWKDAQGNIENGGGYLENMIDWFEGYVGLSDTRATVRVYEGDSRTPEYITVDRLYPETSAREFFSLWTILLRMGDSGDTKVRDVIAAFVRLAEKLAGYKKITDFKGANVVLSEGEWIISDSGTGSRRAQYYDDPIVFDHRNMVKLLPPEFLAELRTVTERYRRDVLGLRPADCSDNLKRPL